MTTSRETLVVAYRAAHYVCGHGANAFVLRIGVPSPPLASLCRAAGASSAAFLTACNPGSEPQPAEVNADAHLRLGADLTAAGYHLVEGAGEDPTGGWTAEPSYLVLAMALDAAQEVGRRYGQNAIVWAGADAVPELVLLR